MPRGDKGGSQEEREHVEMAQENVATLAEMDDAEQPLKVGIETINDASAFKKFSN